MNDLKFFLPWLTCPELISIICLFIPNARKWLLRMIEDSDGDPNHTDGFFVVILWAATLCIRFAILIAWYMIINDKEYTGLVATFLTFGGALLGVRFFKGKLPQLNDLNSETKK